MHDFTEWLVAGERGVSSNAIVSQLTGIATAHDRYDHPHDPDDFTRCAKFLHMYPEVMDKFREEMPKRSPTWAALIERWDEIHKTLNGEIPGYLSYRATGSAPKTYALMREIIDSAKEK